MDKSKWHDLRKNPRDLPNSDKIIYDGIAREDETAISDRVLICYNDGFIITGYFINSCRRDYYWEIGEHYQIDNKNWVCPVGRSNEDVIAWRYIEPFELEVVDDY